MSNVLNIVRNKTNDIGERRMLCSTPIIWYEGCYNVTVDTVLGDMTTSYHVITGNDVLTNRIEFCDLRLWKRSDLSEVGEKIFYILKDDLVTHLCAISEDRFQKLIRKLEKPIGLNEMIYHLKKEL